MSKKQLYLPSSEEVLEYIDSSNTPVSKRELIKAFNMKGTARDAFELMLKDLETSGRWNKNTRRKQKTDFKVIRDASAKKSNTNTITCTVETVMGKYKYLIKPVHEGVFDDGFEMEHKAYLTVGQRVLVRIVKHHGQIKAEFLRILNDKKYDHVGIFYAHTRYGTVEIKDGKKTQEFYIPLVHTAQAEDGDVVQIELLPQKGKHTNARIKKVIGSVLKPKGMSTLTIEECQLRTSFAAEALKEASTQSVPLLKGRVDLRDVPFVTIDGEDARDFDDAVFAQKIDSGWHVIVAIADVAYYVTPGSELDKEAFARGNSTYFPDCVLPMLPEKLSNDLCSLRPNQDRGSLVVHMYLDEQGRLSDFKFERALIRSVARLTYTEVQDMLDETISSPLEELLEPLFDVYQLLFALREERGALDIDVPEYKLQFDASGNVEGVTQRERWDSHKLIEEFMVLANVCAAKALSNKNIPGLYRIHEEPNETKIANLQQFLKSLHLLKGKETIESQKDFNKVMRKSKAIASDYIVSQMVLRSQQQALYSPKNKGHFGLGLTHYAHFTSPIRRYADLVVHRALLFMLGLDAYCPQENDLIDAANHISVTEKRSEDAERMVIDRYISLYLMQTDQRHFTGTIVTVASFGFFVQINALGISGLVPISTLPDFFVYYEEEHKLMGKSSKTEFTLGQSVNVKIQDINLVSSQITFELDIPKKRRR